MSRWLNDGLRGTAELVLSGHECRYRLGDGAATTLCCVTTINADEEGQPAELVHALAAIRAGAGRRTIGLHVRLGSALVYQDTVRVDTAALSRDALHSMLCAHWQAALGDAHGSLAVAYSVQAAGHSTVTSCTSQALVQRICDAASGQGVRVASLTPYSAGVWNAHRRSIPDRSGYLVVCEQDSVIIGAYQDGAWSAWDGVPRAGLPWADLARSVQRFARCHGLDEAWPVWVHPAAAPAGDPAGAGLAHWQLLGTTAARSALASLKLPWRAPRPPLELDFLRPGASTANRPAQLALLAASIPLLGLAIAGYEQEARTLREQSAALDLAAPAPHPRPARKSLSPGDARSTAASAEQVRTIQAQLNYPWQSFLTLLESARQDDVALLALEPDRRSGTTRIDAEARNVTAMLGYLEELQRSGAFDDVVLGSHEFETRRPGTPIRFDLQAHWHAGFRLVRTPAPAPEPAPAGPSLAATAAAPPAAIPPTAVATTAGAN